MPCACESTTPKAPETSSITASSTTSSQRTLASTTLSTVTTTTSGHGTTGVTLCGDKLCNFIRPGSWCRVDNGVCQWTHDPCQCDPSNTTTVQSSTISTSSPASTSQHSPITEEYVLIPKALYVWNPGDLSHDWWDWRLSDIDLLISVCLVHGFNRVIVFIGSLQWDWQTFQGNQLPHEESFVSLFAELRKAGIVPYASYYLNDSPNDLSNWERAELVVSAVHHFNKVFPGSAIEGIDGDQEPTNIGEEYLEMNKMMKAKRDELDAKIKLTASLKPGWLRRSYQEMNMVSLALKTLDAGMIMAYSNSPEISLTWGDQALSLAAGKQMAVAIETSPRAPSTDSFWELASKDQTLSNLGTDQLQDDVFDLATSLYSIYFQSSCGQSNFETQNGSA